MKKSIRQLFWCLLIVLACTVSAATVQAAVPSKVTLNKKTVNMLVGETTTLKATISPSSAKDDKLTWKSSNKNVAAVTSAGKITAKKAGTATITVTTSNGKKATCKVTVSSKKPTKITLDKTADMLLVGEKLTLKPTIAPTNAKTDILTWKTSNKAVATVSAGVVTAKKKGTATITVTTSNGKKATCKITVNPVYADSTDYIRIKTPEGIRTFHKYSQYAYNSYLSNFGCVTTTVSMIASSFGKDYDPKTINAGADSAVYSEKYALKKLTGSSSSPLYQKAAMNLSLASQIFTDLGITNKVVYQFNAASAAKEIKEHLAKGKPVLVKANNQKVNGHKVANGHHALALIGIDEDGTGIFIDSTSRKLNYAHASKTYFKLSIEDFVKNHMTSCTGSNFKNPYVTSIMDNNYTGGGYILVG